MNKITYLILMLTLCFSCNNFKRENKTTIQGVSNLKGNTIAISGFENNSICDIGKEYNLKTDGKNHFQTVVNIDHFSTPWLEAGTGTRNAISRQIYLFPGENLDITINESETIFKGEGAERNNLYSIIENKGFLISQLIHPLMYKKISMEKYLEKLKNFKDKRHQILVEYRKENSLKKEFVDFYNIQTEIQYRNLIVAAFSHSFYTGNKDVNLFKQFKNEIAVENYTNDKWVNFSEYIDNLRNYIFYVKGMEINKTSKNIDYFKSIQIALIDSLKGKSQEFALAEFICSDLNDGKYDSLEINVFNKLTNTDLAKATVENAIDKFHQKEYLIGKPIHKEFAQTLLADTTNRQLSFESMLKSYRGNIVYMEIWSLACGHCRKAMPTSRKLEKELAKLPIKFVYLNTDKYNENLWDDIFRASLTRNNNYRLINGSYSRLNKFMNSTMVPWYLLFDKDGNLLSFNAEEPYSIKDTLIKLSK